MENLSEKVKKIIEEASSKFDVDVRKQSLEKASEEFDILIEKGLASKRGYNLLSSEDVHLQRTASYSQNR